MIYTTTRNEITREDIYRNTNILYAGWEGGIPILDEDFAETRLGLEEKLI